MNQIQIGRFIADCRKELNMTQRQIAERSVSYTHLDVYKRQHYKKTRL